VDFWGRILSAHFKQVKCFSRLIKKSDPSILRANDKPKKSDLWVNANRDLSSFIYYRDSFLALRSLNINYRAKKKIPVVNVLISLYETKIG
jgi:hypothetical protein